MTNSALLAALAALIASVLTVGVTKLLDLLLAVRHERAQIGRYILQKRVEVAELATTRLMHMADLLTNEIAFVRLHTRPDGVLTDYAESFREHLENVKAAVFGSQDSLYPFLLYFEVPAADFWKDELRFAYHERQEELYKISSRIEAAVDAWEDGPGDTDEGATGEEVTEQLLAAFHQAYQRYQQVLVDLRAHYLGLLALVREQTGQVARPLQINRSRELQTRG